MHALIVNQESQARNIASVLCQHFVSSGIALWVDAMDKVYYASKRLACKRLG